MVLTLVPRDAVGDAEIRQRKFPRDHPQIAGDEGVEQAGALLRRADDQVARPLPVQLDADHRTAWVVRHDQLDHWPPGDRVHPGIRRQRRPGLGDPALEAALDVGHVAVAELLRIAAASAERAPSEL